jgi:hypothetical protein
MPGLVEQADGFSKSRRWAPTSCSEGWHEQCFSSSFSCLIVTTCCQICVAFLIHSCCICAVVALRRLSRACQSERPSDLQDQSTIKLWQAQLEKAWKERHQAIKSASQWIKILEDPQKWPARFSPEAESYLRGRRWSDQVRQELGRRSQPETEKVTRRLWAQLKARSPSILSVRPQSSALL